MYYGVIDNTAITFQSNQTNKIKATRPDANLDLENAEAIDIANHDVMDEAVRKNVRLSMVVTLLIQLPGSQKRFLSDESKKIFNNIYCSEAANIKRIKDPAHTAQQIARFVWVLSS